MNTGELIRKYRKEKKMTMKELGENVGVSEQAISQYERGLRKISLETLIKISNVLNVSVNTLTEKKLTISQQILKNEFIDKGISLNKISNESGIKLSEIQSIYQCGNSHTIGTYFNLFRYLGLDDETIIKIMVSDNEIDCIYNNDGTDPIKNKLKKMYLGETLNAEDILLGMEDSDDAEFINHIFQLGKIQNTATSKKEIRTPIGIIDKHLPVDIVSAYESITNLLFYVNNGEDLPDITESEFEVLLKKVCDLLEFELYKLKKEGENSGE